MPKPQKNDEIEESRLMQLSAIHQSRTLGSRHRALSFSSFYATNGSDSEESVVSGVSRAFTMAADYPIDARGKRLAPDTLRAPEGVVGKEFRKKVKKIAKKGVNNDSGNSDELFETARSVPMRHPSRKGDLSRLVGSALEMDDSLGAVVTLEKKQNQLQAARMKLYAARTAIDVQPKLLEKTRRKLMAAEKKNTDGSPGTYSLHASLVLEQNRAENDRVRAGNNVVSSPVSDARMKQMVTMSMADPALTQHLLYTPKYDAKWKNRYTELLVSQSGKKEKKPENRQGWVLPLKMVCEKVGLPTRFFTDNRAVNLPEARSHVLFQRLIAHEMPSEWLWSLDKEAVSNSEMISYLTNQFEPRAMQARLGLYIDSVSSDRDRVRVAGKFYNNIQLGKRMFGPSKKAKFESSIIGGMERRFEILDNQVNHMPFTHAFSDANPTKCRNTDVHCRDSTRVMLSYPLELSLENDFIHANWVRGGPLFNQFIITQAPVKDSVGDFWRMVWQEKVPYIFMLTSRKEEDRCAPYWPRRVESDSLKVHGLRIENMGVNSACDPLFRVTSLRIIGPGGQEHRLEHWQGDMNNSSNLLAPLRVLRIARNCSQPVVIHDCLGISRAACLVATEVAICNIIKGPTYKHLVQKAVQFVRAHRAFSIETPMQYVFIHRCVQAFFNEIGGNVRGMEADYRKWLSERANRMFIDDLNAPVPGFRLLSPRVDPDLLRQVRKPKRPNYRREAPDCVGEWPLPLEESEIITARRRLEV